LFAETMDYQVVFSSPGGLPSPPPVAGSIPRVPSQMLAAFDGTLDYSGPSSVTQPSTARDDGAAPVSSTDPAVLEAFTGAGTLPFHVASAISEVFNGGGANVVASINTFAAATVQVCYRYATTTEGAPPPIPEVSPAAVVVATPRTTG